MQYGEIQKEAITFTCIYCRSSLPRSKASKAHIWAASLGGSISLYGAVCRQCNRDIATQLEDPFKDRWSWLLLFLDVKGRRKKGPPLKATISLLGQEIEINIRSLKAIPNIPPILEKDASGKTTLHFLGSSKQLEKRKKEYLKKHPTATLQEHDYTKEIEASEVTFPIDVYSLDESFSRRLAAKVAFEFWGLKRNTEMLLGSEYDPLREFILKGKEPRQGRLAGLLSDKPLISGNLGNIRIPNHAISLVLHPSTSMLGAIVVFFGMFYYWVILNRRYPFISSISDLTVISPRTKLSVQSVLAGSLKLPRIPWERVLVSEPNHVYKAWKLASEKFEKFTAVRTE
jgi:hypothetical protein